MKIEIWSDVVCPWCYIGKRRLERALGQFEHADEVEISWRSFQLNPDTPPGTAVPTMDYLASRFGPQAKDMTGRVAGLAAAEGLDFDFDGALTVNTLDAHRLLHLAADLGLGDEAKERLLRAHFTEGADLSDHETLTRLLGEAAPTPIGCAPSWPAPSTPTRCAPTSTRPGGWAPVACRSSSSTASTAFPARSPLRRSCRPCGPRTPNRTHPPPGKWHRLTPVRVTSLGFRTDVALRVLEGAEVADRGDHLIVCSPGNPGYWWGNFLLLAGWPAPGTGDRWLARFAAEFPLAHHIALGVDTDPASPDEDDTGGQDDRLVPAEFVAAGLEARRDTVLTCATVGPPPHPNAEAEIRRLESDADWQQSVELSMRCFDHGEPGDYVEARTAARRRLTQAGRGAWFGALAGGQLLAQLGLFDVGAGYARYQHVETDPRARRQGLAGTLVWHAGRYGREVLGAGTFVIVADPADVAIRIYRACGFADTQSQFSFERPSLSASAP